MANSAGISTSFKVELLTATHNFSSHSFKAALYLASATITPATTAYTATGEVSGTNYTAGGVDLTGSPDWIAPTSTGTTAFTTPTANLVYTNVTLSTSFDAVLIYNTSATNKAVMVAVFGGQTITAGTFTLTMPTNDSSTALIRLV